MCVCVRPNFTPSTPSYSRWGLKNREIFRIVSDNFDGAASCDLAGLVLKASRSTRTGEQTFSPKLKAVWLFCVFKC